jgi:DNA polymerase III subunit delta'
VPILPLYGHQALQERIREAADRQSLPASLLLHGPRGVGKQRLGLWIGQLLLCAGAPRPCGACQHCRYVAELCHPDLHWFYPRPRLKDADASPEEVREDYADAAAERAKAAGLYGAASGSDGIYVSTVRALVQLAAMAPALARRKVFLIGDAERMVPQEGSDAAANAFLKLLEEPPADTTIVLTSSEPGALLATIRSRVVSVRVASLRDGDVGAFLDDAAVGRALEAERVPPGRETRLRLAAGAPGALLGATDRAPAHDAARRMLEAVTRGSEGARARLAFAQKTSGARGEYTGTLHVLTSLLRDRVREAVAQHDERMALAASRGIAHVEKAKGLAAGNVNPQLVTARLLRELASDFR